MTVALNWMKQATSFLLAGLGVVQYGCTTVLATWSGCLGSLQIQHQKEPCDMYTQSEHRPDIVIYDPLSGNVELNMAHPWSTDTMSQATRETGYVARRREMKKDQQI